MLKYYLNKSANRPVILTGQNGDQLTIAFDVFGVYGSSMWGVYSTEDESTQKLFSQAPCVKEISEADYRIYLKKKQVRDAMLNSMQYNPKSLQPFGNIVKNAQSAQAAGDDSSAVDLRGAVIRSASEFEAPSAPKIVGGEEILDGKQFASNKEDLARALGMKVWNPRFKFYWRHPDAPKSSERGHDVPQWKLFMDKVSFESSESSGESEQEKA
jgi:hypothetical protein